MVDAKQINIFTLVVLYATFAIVVCFLLFFGVNATIYYVNSYVNDEILLKMFVIVGILMLALLIFRCVKFSCEKLMGLEQLAMSVLIVATLAAVVLFTLEFSKIPLASNVSDGYKLYNEIYGVPILLRYPVLHPLLVVIIPAVLILLYRFVAVKYLFTATSALVWAYTLTVIISHTMLYEKLVMSGTSNMLKDLLIIALPLLVLCALSVKNCLLIRKKARAKHVEKTQILTGIIIIFLVILLIFALFCVTPLISRFDDRDFMGTIFRIFTSMVFVPYIMYFAVTQALYVQYKQDWLMEELSAEKVEV